MRSQSEHHDSPTPILRTTRDYSGVFLVCVAVAIAAALAGHLLVPAERSINVAELSKTAWSKLRKSYAVDSLEELLLLEDDEIDIATAALLIAKEIDAEVDVDEARRQVDEIAGRVLKRIGKEADARTVLDRMNSELFDVEGFVANADGDESASLPHVLSSKSGNCLGFSMLYLAVGRRLGLPFHMVKVPEHVFVRLEDGEVRVNVECTAAGAHQPDGAYRKEHAVGLIDRHLTNMSIRETIALALVDRAARLDRAGQPDSRIVTDIDRAIEWDPTYPTAYLVRASARLHDNDTNAALDDLSRAIELAPKYAAAYVRRAAIYLEGKEYERAIADFDRVTALIPQSPGAIRALADAWVAFHEWEMALIEANRLVELDSGSADAYRFRAKILQKLQCYKLAIVDLDLAIEMEPQSPVAIRARGDARVELGEWDQALVDADCLVALDADSVVAYHFRAEIRVGLQQYELAIADLNVVMELRPDMPINYSARAMVWLKMQRYELALADCDEALLRLGTFDMPAGDFLEHRAIIRKLRGLIEELRIATHELEEHHRSTESQP